MSRKAATPEPRDAALYAEDVDKLAEWREEVTPIFSGQEVCTISVEIPELEQGNLSIRQGRWPFGQAYPLYATLLHLSPRRIEDAVALLHEFIREHLAPLTGEPPPRPLPPPGTVDEPATEPT